MRIAITVDLSDRDDIAVFKDTIIAIQDEKFKQSILNNWKSMVSR